MALSNNLWKNDFEPCCLGIFWIDFGCLGDDED